MPLAWPPEQVEVVTPDPSDEARQWVSHVNVANILPKDRIYLSGFYSAVGYVMDRDADLEEPVVTSNEKFARLHAGSLNYAIDKGEVGRYPVLGRDIALVFLNAVGNTPAAMTDEMREDIVDACDALAWKFDIHGEEL